MVTSENTENVSQKVGFSTEDSSSTEETPAGNAAPEAEVPTAPTTPKATVAPQPQMAAPRFVTGATRVTRSGIAITVCTIYRNKLYTIYYCI